MTQSTPLGPLLVDVEGTALTPADRQLLADPAVGGAIVFTRNYANPQQLAALTADMRAARSNLVIVADYEGGRVQRFREGFTPIPPMRSLGQCYRRDPQGAHHAARELAWLMAKELQQVGIDMPMAPVLDRDYGHDAGAIGSRALADRPDWIAGLAESFVQGLEEAGSTATIKHFPGHGHVAMDSHKGLPVDDRAWAELSEDMAPFRMLIERGVASVLMAHIRYTEVDPVPASLSSTWIDGVLRKQFGFRGCVFCDDLSMGGAAAMGDYAERVRRALAAGCDFLPVCNDRQAALTARRAVHEGAPDRGAARRATLAASLAQTSTPSDSARLQEARRLAQQLCES